MYANLHFSLKINDKQTPKHNEYIRNEYQLKKEAEQILLSQLINMAIKFSKNANIDEFIEFVNRICIDINKESEPSYYNKADDNAKELIIELIDEIVEQFIEDGEIGEDIRNDFNHGDSLFHETIVGRYYSAEEAIKLLSSLHEYEETDSGLWEGQEWEQILSSKAAWTYGNAVYDMATDILTKIGNSIDMEEIDLEVAKEILKETEWETLGYDDKELVEMVKEQFEELFNDKLKTRLEKEIREILE